MATPLPPIPADDPLPWDDDAPDVPDETHDDAPFTVAGPSAPPAPARYELTAPPAGHRPQVVRIMEHARPLPARTLRDVEHAIGVDPIDVLLADRRAVMDELAPLKAKYGPFGTWDARRKAFRSAVANELALRIQERGEKRPSEAELERLAAGDERVLRFLDTAEHEMARYYLLDNQAQDLTDLINRGQAVIRYAAAEPRA